LRLYFTFYSNYFRVLWKSILFRGLLSVGLANDNLRNRVLPSDGGNFLGIFGRDNRHFLNTPYTKSCRNEVRKMILSYIYTAFWVDMSDNIIHINKLSLILQQNQENNYALKILKKILLIIGILAIVGLISIWDIFDRGQFYSRHISADEQKEFYMYETWEQQQKAFEKNFGVEKYKFPRKKVSEIKLFKNTFLTSRLTSKTVSNLNKSDLISFFNNPINFDWSETTWDLSESEYILRFYDDKDNEIGKIWLCLEDCGMTGSIPFSPNMKYGGLSENGRKNINRILTKILTE